MNRLGRYRLERELGRGGMAEVYLARAFGASGFEKRVAVKVARAEQRGSSAERLLIEEAKLAARLSHRNLLGVHELGVDDGTYYAVMDYVDGADLATLARAEQPSVELALLVAEELASALDYLHAATDESGRPLGLVHRDLGPSNVLVSRAGEVVLADFGIAKATALADATAGGVRKGTYAYMSPEQVAGDPLTSSSDQFGLGVLLYELLAGRRPFDADGVLATMQAIQRADPPDTSFLPDDLAAVLGRALARDPGDRFVEPGALRDALSAARRRRPDASPRDLGAWVARAAPP